MKNTASTLLKQKQSGEKITMLTAYDYTTARIEDECGVNSILIGDSLGMVMQGFDDTLPVTMDQMVYHTKMVSKGAPNAFIVADMPFMSYQVSLEQAVANAGRLVKEGGANAVKLEGGEEVLESIQRILSAGIPVMGHLGLTPQSINKFGTYAVRATEEDEANRVIHDAHVLEEAGCFSMVLEKIPAALASRIASEVKIPVIGIGAGSGVDGQVLVLQDMLGITQQFKPRYLRLYGHIGEDISHAIQQYISDVKSESFPNEKEQY